MILFYSTDQSESNRDYYKGTLFENLLARYLDASGYEIEIRRKHNSLEYDLEGENRASRTRIVGEAKAHTKPISGQVFSAFVGKIVPLGLFDRTITGLFLSTSALTPDADDYYGSVQQYGLVTHTGEQLVSEVRSALRLPVHAPLYQKIQEDGLDPKQHLFLTTNVGDYIVVTAGDETSATASQFAVFRPNGSPLQDQDFLQKLTDGVKELQALTPVVGSSSTGQVVSRDIPQGLTLGSDWTDFRLPAAPSFFVGRVDFLQQVKDHIRSGHPPFVLQIKSRSGVGKSSVMATLENGLSEDGVHTELHDARDVKSVLDVYALVQRFAGLSSMPPDFRAVADGLRELNRRLTGQRAVFFVDQFESTFANPEVFQAYESIASLHQGLGPSLYFVLGRKNDQLTTYDDSAVSIDRLNQMSRSYELKDFTNPEARELIDEIIGASGTQISAAVLAYVFEFAQGFPWLIKRTMAHLLRLLESGVSQRDLFSAGLQLDDLFNEELEGLDEIQRDYLFRIAARLPADYTQLQRQFDEDPLLTSVLDTLTQARLLRLTGATYDTYNDVFKEYLVYRKLPEFRQPIIYRMYPNGVIATFHQLVEMGAFTIDELEQRLGSARGSAFNKLMELRNLNLLRKEGDRWDVPQSVRDVYGQGQLGEYVRQQLASNDIVARLVNAAAQGAAVAVSELPQYLSEQLPFVEASGETWGFYANVLRAWLVGTSLLRVSPEKTLVLPEEDRSRIIEDLGNLIGLAARGRGNPHGLWLPTTTFSYAVEVVRKLLQGEEVDSTGDRKVLVDIRNAGWSAGDAPTFETVDDFHNLAREILEIGDYDDVWAAARRGDLLLPVFQQVLGPGLAEATLKWRLKQLLNWAKSLGVIPAQRYRYGTLQES